MRRTALISFEISAVRDERSDAAGLRQKDEQIMTTSQHRHRIIGD